jgi:hypothetical protein
MSPSGRTAEEGGRRFCGEVVAAAGVRSARRIMRRSPAPPKACPRCKAEDTRRVSFTWWGGLLGPWLLDHTVCDACGLRFNGRTGRSNAAVIAIYVVVSAVLAGLGLHFLPDGK